MFISTDCPMALRYAPRITKLVETFASKGIQFEAKFPNREVSRREVGSYMNERGYKFPFDLDLGAKEAKAAGVEGVPTFVVYDGNGRKVYLGALDDNKEARLVKKSYVSDTLRGILAGKPLKFLKTSFQGCVLMPDDPPVARDKVNYAEHVAPIIQKHCLECHRRGQVAPFSLEGYENARRWSPMLAVVTRDRRMPLWKAVHGFGEFRGENSLSETDIATIANWDREGAPKGDLSKEPKSPIFPDTWHLGQPDVIVGPPSAYTLAADGSDIYRNFVIKTDFKEKRWVKAISALPSNPKIVHRVIAYVDTVGKASSIQAAQNDGFEGYTSYGTPGFVPGDTLGAWAPASRPPRLPNGTAFELPAGATIVMQVHYHRTGRDETDLTRLGLYFAKEPIKKRVQLAWLAPKELVIPPVDTHKAKQMIVLERATTIYSVMPHLRYLGKTFKVTALLPDGSSEPVVWIDPWDFNWQFQYTLKEPLKLPAKAQLIIEATFDNSASNINNPNDPPKEVRNGEDASDEMFVLVATVSYD